MPALRLAVLCAGLAVSFPPSLQAEEAPAVPESKSFEFKDGDRLVLLGSTVLEREQRYSTLEPLLHLALGETKISVRNLAWSGDTVFGHARSYFGPPAEGLQRLSTHLDMLKPTVVLLCYGSEMAFEGLGGLPDFLSGYRNLVDLIRSKAPGVRLIIMSPPPLENLPPPLPDQSDANKRLDSLRDALRKFAITQNAFYIDAFELMGGVPKAGPTAAALTENGVHYTRQGYEKLSREVIGALGLTAPVVTEAEIAPLKEAVKRKDELFFDRWRPQNETYLFGFRKHEQGQNAKEIPMFDPLIQKADAKIQDVKKALLAGPKRA